MGPASQGWDVPSKAVAPASAGVLAWHPSPVDRRGKPRGFKTAEWEKTISTTALCVFTREFKLDLCRQITSGQKQLVQVCREHQLTEGLLRWRREYEQRGEAAFSAKESAEVSPTASLEQKVAELERFCGQLSLENALLKKLANTPRPPRELP
jgi:transposase